MSVIEIDNEADWERRVQHLRLGKPTLAEARIDKHLADRAMAAKMAGRVKDPQSTQCQLSGTWPLRSSPSTSNALIGNFRFIALYLDPHHARWIGTRPTCFYADWREVVDFVGAGEGNRTLDT